MNPKQIQQGDVLLRLIPNNQLPKGCKRRPGRTLAHGEQTGHHHTWDNGVAILDTPDGRTFAVNETSEPKTLTHQEHKPVVLAPGQACEFGQVIEKDWFTEMTRPVMD